MRRLLIVALFFSFCHLALHADEASAWGPLVKGLRGRLVISTDLDHPTNPVFQIFLELENKRHFPLYLHAKPTWQSMKFQVVNEHGEKLAPAGLTALDGMGPAMPNPLVIKSGESTSLRIDDLGLSFSSGAKQKISLCPRACWNIPDGDGHTYFLKGTFTVNVDPSDRRSNWSGVLDLPSSQIPSR